MVVSPTALLSSVVSCVLLTLLAWAVVKNDFALRAAGRQIIFFLAVIAARMLLPVEFRFTVTFPSRHVMTGLRDLMMSTLNFGAFEVTVGQTLILLWAVGAVCKFFIRALGYLHLKNLTGKCPGYFKHDVGAVIDRVNGAYGKKGRFEVLLFPGIRTPAIFGVMHPKILMPMTDYTQEEIYYILKHEMLHYYHHDMLLKMLCEFLGVIYWWNPIVFLFNKIIARVLEIRVDSILASGLNEDEKTGYLECIVKSMRAGRQGETALLITFAAQKGEAMKQRFRCICGGHWQKSSQRGIVTAALSCLLFLASVSVIAEADYNVDIPGTFSKPSPENAYLLEKDGCYQLYIDGEFKGEMLEIAEVCAELKIYRDQTDIINEKMVQDRR